MDFKHAIKKQVDYTDKLINDMSRCIDVMNKFLERNDYQEFYKQSFKLQSISERLTNSSRGIPSIMGSRTAIDEINSVILKESELEIKFTDEGWFKVTIPALLPKKEKGDVSYIRGMLQAGMKDFFKDKEFLKFNNKSVIVFKHNYCKDRPDREYRDHDNIELNAVVDLVALYVLIDDHPFKLEHFYCSSKAELDSTEVIVIPKEEFISWLQKEEVVE